MTSSISIKKLFFVLIAFSAVAAMIIGPEYSWISSIIITQSVHAVQLASSTLPQNNQLNPFGNLNASSNPNQFNIRSNVNPFPNLPSPGSSASTSSLSQNQYPYQYPYGCQSQPSSSPITAHHNHNHNHNHNQTNILINKVSRHNNPYKHPRSLHLQFNHSNPLKLNLLLYPHSLTLVSTNCNNLNNKTNLLPR